MTADQEVVAHCIVLQNRPFYYVWTEEGGGGGNADAAIPRLRRASIEHRTRNVILYCISLKSLRFSEEPSDGKERPYPN
jgi:hypothetical protein